MKKDLKQLLETVKELIVKLTSANEENMWKEIMKKAVDEEGHGISATVDTYTLRKILEKYNLLPKTKNGM